MYYNDILQTIPQCGTSECPYSSFREIAMAQVPADPAAACEIKPILPLRNSTIDSTINMDRLETQIRTIYAERDIHLFEDFSVVDFAMLFTNGLKVTK
jgi:hypothetical protein